MAEDILPASGYWVLAGSETHILCICLELANFFRTSGNWGVRGSWQQEKKSWKTCQVSLCPPGTPFTLLQQRLPLYPRGKGGWVASRGVPASTLCQKLAKGQSPVRPVAPLRRVPLYPRGKGEWVASRGALLMIDEKNRPRASVSQASCPVTALTVCSIDVGGWVRGVVPGPSLCAARPEYLQYP